MAKRKKCKKRGISDVSLDETRLVDIELARSYGEYLETEMAVWLIRAGRYGEYEDMCIDRGLTAVDFGLGQSVAEFESREALRASELAETSANQLWRFYDEIQLGDMIVLPCKRTRVIAVGRVVGEYGYCPDESPSAPHTRAVTWDATDVPRSGFDQDLINSFGALGTVSQPQPQDAEERIAAVVKAYLEQADELVPAADAEMPPTDPNDEVDLDQQIKDRIVARLKQRFAGVRLEHLVASILRASDYQVLETAAGPDGGVDIVAGAGELGFSQPRLCVQVKGRRGPVDLAEYDRLLGNLETFRAEHGLLVSLGGFTKPVKERNTQTFFRIRLWGPDELAQRLLDAYEELPVDIRADVPLRDRKVLEESNVSYR